MVGESSTESKSEESLNVSASRSALPTPVSAPLFYGRDSESQMLRAAYERHCGASTSNNIMSELVIVNGASGTGKTSLVYHVLQPLVQQQSGGMFLSGKFDQPSRHKTGQVPYGPFVTAFSNWVEKIRSQDVLSHLQDQLVQELDMDERSLLADTVPALATVLQVPSDLASRRRSSLLEQFPEFDVSRHLFLSESQLDYSNELSQDDEDGGGTQDRSLDQTGLTGGAQKQRFLAAFVSFLRITTSRERPLVLFLDDLQWADQSSLDLLSALALREKHNGLMLLGAVRGNEVGLDDVLAVALRAMEDANVIITNIELHNFDRENVKGMVAQQFPTDDLDRVSNDVYNQTDGNAFYIAQLMTLYQQKGVLTRNVISKEWHWDENRIENRNKRNVSDVMKDALHELPEAVQLVLKVAACIGSKFQERHVKIVLPDIDVRAALEIASEKGIVQYASGRGMFNHDRLQEAAYKLIPENRRSILHASIGRNLLNAFSEEELDENIFLVVNQFGAGIEEIIGSRQRDRLSILCLRAGEKAVVSSAFEPAASYLDIGISCLDSSYWKYQYNLSLALFSSAAEVEYCNGRFDKMDRHIKEVFANAKTFNDKIRSYTSHVFALGAQQKFQEAIDTGLYVLSELGMRFPARPRKIHAIIAVLKTKRLLRGKTADDIVNLPVMTNPETLAALHMLNLISLYVFFTRQAYLPLMSTRFVQTALSSGLCGFGSSGFGYHAMLTCGVLGDIDGGYFYAQIALRLLEKFHAKAYVARVYVPVYGMVTSWKEPVRNSFGPLKLAYRNGLDSGDMEFAMLAATLYVFSSLFAGAPLIQLQSEVRTFLAEGKSHKQQGILSLVLPAAQMIDNLMGNAKSSPSLLTGDFMDEETYLRHPEHKKGSAHFVSINLRRLMCAYVMNDLETSSISAANSRGIEKEIVSSLSASMQAFYDGLSCIALARREKNRWRRASKLQKARRSWKKLKRWETKAPHNFADKVYLLEAELASMAGRVDSALDLYKQAIAEAEKEGFIHNKAVASERMGDTLLRGGSGDARACFETARDAYQEWGARAKVDQLDEMIAELWPSAS